MYNLYDGLSHFYDINFANHLIRYLWSKKGIFSFTANNLSMPRLKGLTVGSCANDEKMAFVVGMR
jgi:hypothetical protein